MGKAIYFDLDGTLANLYAVDGWLDALRSYLPFPYLEAKPMCDMIELIKILGALKSKNYTIGVITWLSKESNKEYDCAVRKAKRLWLKKYGLWDFIDEIHMVKYGTPKHRIAKIRNSILIDDDVTVRANWKSYGGITINPVKENILDALRKLI